MERSQESLIATYVAPTRKLSHAPSGYALGILQVVRNAYFVVMPL
jgi:hypothetical protein